MLFSAQDYNTDSDHEGVNQRGRKVSSFVLDTLDTTNRQQGTSSEIYKKECEFYTEVMENACKGE